MSRIFVSIFWFDNVSFLNSILKQLMTLLHVCISEVMELLFISSFSSTATCLGLSVCSVPACVCACVYIVDPELLWKHCTQKYPIYSRGVGTCLGLGGPRPELYKTNWYLVISSSSPNKFFHHEVNGDAFGKSHYDIAS